MSGVERRSRLATARTIVALSLILAPVTPAAATESTPTAPSPVPLPEGQSDEPAPASRAKTIVGNVHTDAVSAFIDDGELVLETKVDMDVTGDGVVDLGSRVDPATVLFHLAEDGNGVDSGRIAVPDIPGFEFLGEPGSTIWMAPQTQDMSIIWPGFSTEAPELAGRVQDDRVSVRLTHVDGPGELEMYLQTAAGPQRSYSSVDALAAWPLNVPQHQHMNWAFDAAGTYTLTFEMSAVVDGRRQTASNEYVFVVGDLGVHTRATSTVLRSSANDVDQGEPVLLTADVSPEASGAVQFRDLSTGSILGHTPVEDGAASFRVDALTPGDHRIVAEFVPTWSTDFAPSTSSPLTVSVAGEVLARPTEDDSLPVPESELSEQSPGTEVVVTTTGRTLDAGRTLNARVTDDGLAGQWISVWIPGDSPAWRGWVQADLDGDFSVPAGSGLQAGGHRLVVKSRDGDLIGWDAFTVTTPATGGPTPGAPPPEQPASPPAQAAPQTCQPALTLETGHIDAFYVSAASGRAVLQLMEDVTGHRVIREPEQVLLRVKPAAYRTGIPAGTPGAPSGYVLPLTQNPALIWPGWDTNRTAASGYTDVSITVSAVNGPGRVSVSSQGSFGGVISLLTGGGYTLPGTIRERVPAHTHAQWVFSDEGIYTLTAHAVATNPSNGDSLRTATRTYTFQVGDVPLGDTFCSLSPVGVADSAAVNAAVNRAAADAVAAAQTQADAAAAAAETEARKRAARAQREREPAEEDAAQGPAAASASPVVIGGIVGGGALIVAGIIGAALWYVRRIGASGPSGSGEP